MAEAKNRGWTVVSMKNDWKHPCTFAISSSLMTILPPGSSLVKKTRGGGRQLLPSTPIDLTRKLNRNLNRCRLYLNRRVVYLSNGWEISGSVKDLSGPLKGRTIMGLFEALLTVSLLITAFLLLFTAAR
jgi:hypothetical protein